MKEVTAYQSTLTQMDSVVVDGVWLTTRSNAGESKVYMGTLGKPRLRLGSPSSLRYTAQPVMCVVATLAATRR